MRAETLQRPPLPSVIGEVPLFSSKSSRLPTRQTLVFAGISLGIAAALGTAAATEGKRIVQEAKTRRDNRHMNQIAASFSNARDRGLL